MFCHPAWAIGSCSSGLAAHQLPKLLELSQLDVLTILMGHPVFGNKCGNPGVSFQVTLGRMVFDMMKWALLFLLVHFAFSCGECRNPWLLSSISSIHFKSDCHILRICGFSGNFSGGNSTLLVPWRVYFDLQEDEIDRD